MRQPGEHTFTQKPLQEVDANGDVVFRFALRPREPVGDPEQALESFYRGQLQDLLRVVALTFRGERVMVDGFSFLSDTQTTMPLWPAKAKSPAVIAPGDAVVEPEQGP